MKSIINSRFFLALAALTIVVGISSCGVPDAPKAEITVLDTLDERVEGATVMLICTPIERTTCVLGDTAETNSDGVSEHEVAYESVLQIFAYKQYKQGSNTVLLTGESFVKLVPGETAKETVVIEAN